ncbi:DUF4190 domain-containing protein [Candidatus Pacearchaeota archaeon]|nr:DUF4190 domain-containing protein [Candidatus Pacearchaeota archaeon]
MFCSECGVENVDGSGSCRSCGSVLGGAVVPVAAAVKVEAAKTSRLAIAALVLGILSVFTFGLILLPAVICGVIAMVKVSKSGGALKGKGFAIAGIVVSVVTLLILLAVLMPALGVVNRMAQQAVCAGNMKAFGASIMIYAADHDNAFPPADKWCDLITGEVAGDPKSFQCPGVNESRSCNYAMNENVAKFGGSAPVDMVLLFESKAGWNLSGGAELLTADNHCGEGANILFADGHVEFVKSERFGSLNWGGK